MDTGESSVAPGRLNVQSESDSHSRPLHAALALPDVNGKRRTVRALIESGANCDLMDQNGLTACEYALSVCGDRKLAAEMIEAEVRRLSSVTDRGFQVMIRRGSLRVFRLFLEVGKFEDGEVYEKVATALIELSARRVTVNRELEVYLQYRLAEYAFRSLDGGLMVESVRNASEWRMHFDVIESNWKELKRKYNDRSYAKIDYEFVARVKTVHNHLYFVKDKRFLKHLPMMETVFCLAMFVSICKWPNKFKIFKMMIDKLKVMKFLDVVCKQLDRIRSLMNSLQNKLELFLHSIDKKDLPCKQQLMDTWTKDNPTQKLGENLINKIINGIKRSLQHNTIINEIIAFESVEISSKINRKDRSTIALLKRCYFRAKQLYSIEKCIFHVNALPTNSVDIMSDRAAAPAIKRVIQVIGEAIKSTKNSPNVPKKVAELLEQLLTPAFPTTNKYFREFFSHKYSFIKRILYEQPEVNTFTALTKHLGQVKMIFSLLFVCSILEASRSLLGAMRRCQDRNQLASLLQYVGDLKSIEETQTRYFVQLENSLRKMTEDFSDVQVSMGDRQANLDQLMGGMEKKSAILDRLQSCLISKWTFSFGDIRLACYGKVELATIHGMVRWNLMCYGQNEVYDVIKSHWKSHQESMALLQADDNKILDHNPSVMGGILTKIEMRITMIEEEEYLTNSRKIMEDLGQIHASKELVNSFHRCLLRYYENIFFVDNKFKAIKQFFKSNKIPLSEERIKDMRMHDEELLQQFYDESINKMREILLIEDITSVENMAAEAKKIPARIILALEYCQLELCEMLISVGYFGDNFDLLKHRIPMISGRNYRNYLAHDFLSYNILTESDRLKVIINALVMVKNPIKLFRRSNARQNRAFVFPKVENVDELIDGIQSMNSKSVKHSDISGICSTTVNPSETLKSDYDLIDSTNTTHPNEEVKKKSPKQDQKDSSIRNQGKSLLHHFIKDGNFQKGLETLSVNKDFDINTQDANDCTALDLAIHLGFYQISKLLLSKNPRISDIHRELTIIHHWNDFLSDLFSKCKTQTVPDQAFLRIAVRSDNIPALEFLVDHLYRDCSWDVKNKHLTEALVDAAYFNHTKTVQYLLGLSNVHFFSDHSITSGHSALQNAIYRRNWPVVKLFLDRGASPNWINKFRGHRTAFQVAVEFNSLRVLRMMKNIDRQLYRSLEHPMSIAIRNNSHKVIRFLRKMGFSLLDSNRNLQTAIECGNEKYIDQIFDDLMAIVSEWNYNDGPLGRIGQLIARLVAIGYLEERESNSLTAVMQAVTTENWGLLSVLLDKSKGLRKFEGWFINRIEVFPQQETSIIYGTQNLNHHTEILYDCNKPLELMKNYAFKGESQPQIISVDHPDDIKVDLHLLTTRNAPHRKIVISEKQNIPKEIVIASRTLIKGSKDIVFGSVHLTQITDFYHFIIFSDGAYLVQLTPTEPLNPLKPLVNVGDVNGETPLHMMAISRGNSQTISLLLENGANPIAMNTLGQTPLHIALVAKEEYRSILLLSHIVAHDLRASDGISALVFPNGQGCHPIHYAAMSGKLAAVQFLLQRNVNVRKRDQMGRHPACYAAGCGYSKMLRAFLEHDPTLVDLVDSQGQTLLHISTKREEEDTIMILLEYGASLTAVNNEGETPVELAIGSANAPWLKIVLFYARVHGIRGLVDSFSDNSFPALHYAIFSNKKALLTAVVEYKIDADLDMELPSESLEILRSMLCYIMPEVGFNALHVAVQLNLKSSIAFLMDCQGIVNQCSEQKINIVSDAVDLKGKTPLDYALDAKDETVISMLLGV